MITKVGELAEGCVETNRMHSMRIAKYSKEVKTQVIFSVSLTKVSPGPADLERCSFGWAEGIADKRTSWGGSGLGLRVG